MADGEEKNETTYKLRRFTKIIGGQAPDATRFETPTKSARTRQGKEQALSVLSNHDDDADGLKQCFQVAT